MNRSPSVTDLTRRNLLTGLAGFGLVGLAGCAGDPTTHPGEPGSPPANPTSTSGSSAEPTPHSGLPLFTDEYIGFVVGRPPDWEIAYENGLISLMPSGGDDTTVAFVYPVVLSAGTAIEDAVGSFVGTLQNQFVARGGQLSMAGSRLSGTLGGVSLSGEVRTRTVGLQHVIFGGWAPATEWSSLEGTILGVGAAYDRRPGQALIRHAYVGTDIRGSETEWEYVVPQSWEVAGAHTWALEIIGDFVPATQGYNARVGFCYIPFAQGNHTPASFASMIASAMGETGGFNLISWGRSRDLGTHTDAMEAGEMRLETTWELQSFEFQSMYGSGPYRGVMTVAVANYSIGYPREQPYYSGMIWYREVAESERDRLAAITAVVQSYIRVVGHREAVGSGITSPVTNAPDYGDDITDIIVDVGASQSASRERTHREFSEYIGDYDTCYVPSMGTTAQMPRSTYYPTGLNGGPPGRYVIHEDGTPEYTPPVR
jgi:hypothetical protein